MNLCEAMAIALSLTKSFFADKHDKQDNALRLLHYPPIEQTPSPEQLRAGEHSDYGSFTLLFQVVARFFYTKYLMWLSVRIVIF